jgi:hypothetical protein
MQGHKQGQHTPVPARHVDVASKLAITSVHPPFFARFTLGSSTLISKTSCDCCLFELKLDYI